MRVIDCSQDKIKGNLTKFVSKIRTQFLPKLTGRVSPRDLERHVLKLQARLGGLTIINPETDVAQKLKDSERLCKPLVEKILSSDTDFDGIASRRKRVSTETQKENERRTERILCCNRFSKHHTQQLLNWLTKEARQTGSQRFR